MITSVSFIDPSVTTAGDLCAPAQRPREIVFIDPGIDAIDTFLSGLRPEVEPILLNAVEPAPCQMANVLAGREGLEVIHVVAHGAPGQVLFTAGTLSAETLHDYADEMARGGTSARAGAAKLALVLLA